MDFLQGVLTVAYLGEGSDGRLMDPFLQGVLTTLGILVALKLLYLLVVGKGSFARFGLAWSAFNKVMGDAEVADKVKPLLTPPDPTRAAKLSGVPLRLLALLQRESRLLDFLLEDISAAQDVQVGAGVRELHRKAQEVLKDRLVLEPVINKEEDTTVDVPAGFDPSAVRLTGNVSGQPPFKGVLKHRGWRVKDYRLPAPPEGQDELVVYPAEVEIP
jgi:hypothetical protein